MNDKYFHPRPTSLIYEHARGEVSSLFIVKFGTIGQFEYSSSVSVDQSSDE